MMRSSIRRTLTFLAFTTFVPVLVMGCPKKEPAVTSRQGSIADKPSAAPSVYPDSDSRASKTVGSEP